MKRFLFHPGYCARNDDNLVTFKISEAESYRYFQKIYSATSIPVYEKISYNGAQFQ